jgi:hypothetical protein
MRKVGGRDVSRDTWIFALLISGRRFPRWWVQRFFAAEMRELGWSFEMFD